MTLNMKRIVALTERRGRLLCAGDIIHHKSTMMRNQSCKEY